MTEETPICYRVNERDELIFVNDAWQTSALEHEGTALAPADVLQRPLFDFIADETTRLLYRDLLHRVRAGYPVQFPLRCDTPAQRRWHEMTITLIEPGIVEFTTRLLRSEDRAIAALFFSSATPSALLLCMCSWCKQVEVDNQQWVEVEEAVLRLNLFEPMQPPQVTHGICKTCLVSLKKQIHLPDMLSGVEQVAQDCFDHPVRLSRIRTVLAKSFSWSDAGGGEEDSLDET